ncbi:MAG: hypothetical protein WDN03_05050 [Rhizomicrobium sp.]
MKARLVIVLLLCAGAGGCASAADRIAARIGLPPRGFVSDALFPDSAPSPAAARVPGACTAVSCPQAANFCTARGYQPGTDGYDRCLISVEQNLRR